jgi:hypothetical protein
MKIIMIIIHDKNYYVECSARGSANRFRAASCCERQAHLRAYRYTSIFVEIHSPSSLMNFTWSRVRTSDARYEHCTITIIIVIICVILIIRSLGPPSPGRRGEVLTRTRALTCYRRTIYFVYIYIYYIIDEVISSVAE